MTFRKQLTAFCLVLSLILSNIAPVLAAGFLDIQPEFRAYKEIMDVTNKKIMTGTEPEIFDSWGTVTRAEFTGMLVRALRQENLPIKIQNKYPDINSSTKEYQNILRADQLELIYGYPEDGTFRPDHVITKSETASMLAHVAKTTSFYTSLLLQFQDYKEVREWAQIPYAKSIHYGWYYNDPDPTKLTPNNELHRYEAAVLLAKLSNNLQLVKEEFLPKEVIEAMKPKPQPEPEKKVEAPKKPEPPKEYILSAEHLDIYPNAAVNKVTITNFRRIVLAKNVFKVSFVESFNSKKHQIGDVEVFYFKNDIKTREGTLIFPANTKLYATIAEIKKPKAINKNAQVYFDFKKLEFPNGKSVPFTARVLNDKDGYLVENYWLKPLEYTIAGAAIGTGAGLGIGAGAGNTTSGLAIGLPVGAGLGLATGFLTKGVNFKAKANEDVLVELKLDCNLYNE